MQKSPSSSPVLNSFGTYLLLYFQLVRSPLFTSIQRPFTVLYPWRTTSCLNIFSSFVPLSEIAHTESALPSYFSLSMHRPISMLFVIDRSCRLCLVISDPSSRTCWIIRTTPLTPTRSSTCTKEPLLLRLLLVHFGHEVHHYVRR